MKIMKISLEELNLSYEKVTQIKKQYREDGIKLPSELEVAIDRNPLTDEYFDDKSDFVTPFKLKFELMITDNAIETYFLTSNVVVLDQDLDDDN